jgi:urate oxidase
MLSNTAYGKSSVRLVKISRHGDRHDLKDVTVAIRFEGDFDRSYTHGENADVLPTDTMKNTVYALAAAHSVDEPEAFGALLARHFIDRNPKLRRVRVDLREHSWGRIAVGARSHNHAFVSQGAEVRSARVIADQDAVTVSAGIENLVVLKSSRSAFTGFLRDEYTTLADATDRILATAMTATWTYRPLELDYNLAWRAVRTTLLETFAEHDSQSVQHTLHAMASAALDNVEALMSIHLVMPNRHHLPVDVSRFGLDNRNEIFVPTDEPFGLIEATLRR